MSLSVSAVVIAIASLCLLQQSHGQDISLSFTPSAGNSSVFVGQEFQRLCTLTGTDGEAAYEWLFNNNVVATTGHLLLLSVGYEHAGEYFCRANLTSSGSTVVIGPNSVGFLNVLDPSRVIAPPTQYALLGSSVTLQCETEFAEEAISWTSGDQIVATGELTIEDVSVEDEGTYVCRIFVGLGEAAASTNRPVELKVIVPPEVTSQPSSYTVFEGPSPRSLEVTFRSRPFQDTTVSWFRDTSPISENRIQSAPINDSQGITTLSFPSPSRSDDGVYSVVIKNNINSPTIPEGLRSAEISFQLRISIQPATPVNLRVAEHTSSTSALIRWTLTNQNADDAADSLTLTVGQPTIGENDRVYLLSGTKTETTVVVFPGMEYAMSLAAQNRDGISTTELVTFDTPSREPSVSSVDIVRVNQTAFQLTVNVDYTGGGDITHFTVSFRKSGSTDDFNHLGDIPASPQSMLVWNGVITNAEFASLEVLEFDVTVNNERSFSSTTSSPVQEATVLPGAPVALSLISSTTTSLTIAVQLSQVGTLPILLVLLRISGPAGFSTEQNVTRDFIFSGEILQLTAEGLLADTEYQVEGLAVNRAGTGPSREAAFRTIPFPSSSSLPLWVIVVIVVGSVVAMVALLTVVCVGCCIRRRRKNGTSGQKTFYTESNTYVSATAEEKKLDPSHEILKRQSNKGFVGLSAGPLTPRSPTTTATPITVISAEDLDGPFSSQFKFDANSVNSDDSDTTFPRYTYRVSPSPGDSVPSLTTRTGSDTLLSPPPRPSYATDV